VFAPTNEAFAKLPPATLKHLLDPANIKELQDLLEYHVIPGSAVYSKDLKADQSVATLEGKTVEITKSGGDVTINGKSHVTAADNAATNGVVHIIDTVLVPPTAAPTKNIVELATSDDDLATLVSALKAGKLVSALEATGPFTVFAPTNEAFAKLPPATLKHLLDPANIKELQDLLEYHVIPGSAVYSKDLKADQSVATLEGKTVEITKSGGDVTINGKSHVTAADNAATNGVVHIIDTVLVPPASAAVAIVV